MGLKKTTLSLDADDVAAAKALDLSLSEICRTAIASAVRDARLLGLAARAGAVRERLEATDWEPPADAGAATDRAWTER